MHHKSKESLSTYLYRYQTKWILEQEILPRIGVTLQNGKRLIHQENVTIMIVYVPNNRTSNCLKQKLMKLQGERDKHNNN